MKIIEIHDELWVKYQNKLRIIKKWIFWVILNEEAFFMAKNFNFKITSLDKQNIKIGFPDSSKKKWLEVLEEKGLWYVLYDKKTESETIKKWKYTWDIFSIDIDDYNLTRDRILKLKEFNLESKNTKNFLLKDKIEDIYMIMIDLLLKLPRKERYFFREKIEKLFLDLFEQVYIFMYNLWDRKIIIKDIFNRVMVLREFTRFLYKLWKIKNDNVYLDLWDKWIEVLKICKWIIR